MIGTSLNRNVVLPHYTTLDPLPISCTISPHCICSTIFVAYFRPISFQPPLFAPATYPLNNPLGVLFKLLAGVALELDNGLFAVRTPRFFEHRLHDLALVILLNFLLRVSSKIKRGSVMS